MGIFAVAFGSSAAILILAWSSSIAAFGAAFLTLLRGRGFSGSSLFSNGFSFFPATRFGFASSSFFSKGLFSLPGLGFSTFSASTTGVSSFFSGDLTSFVSGLSSSLFSTRVEETVFGR